MAYPFKKVPHCVYAKTFLKDVRMAIVFPAVDPASLKQALLNEYFEQFTGANIKADAFLQSGWANIISNDHFVDFKFSLNYAEVKISAQKYTSFEQAAPYWQMLFDFVDAMRIELVEKLILRKYNALYFKANSSTYNVKNVMDEVFCDELMALMSDIDKEGSLNSIEKTQMFEDAASDSVFSAVFGIKKADAAVKNDHLTLVTAVETKNGPVASRDIPDCVKKYNEILFDAFHWCVKDSIIQNMK